MKRLRFKADSPWAEGMTVIMQLGLTMAGCIGFCFYIGFKLDQWIGTGGIFTAVFIIFGVVGGAVVTYRQIMETLGEPDPGQEHKSDPEKSTDQDVR